MSSVGNESEPHALSIALGMERVISVDAQTERAVIEYRAGAHMCHSGGVVQGGFIAGWLDSAMSHAAMAATGGEMSPMTLEMKVSYFAPARPGLVTAEGWVERRGRTTAFLEGRLLNPSGDVIAKASATARFIPRAQVEARSRMEIE
jgi:acyl-CoA thioesterase